jgi:hypothetical protein
MTTDALRRPSLGRLTRVELRKAVDTRAGFWLQLAVVAATLVVVVLLAVFAEASDRQLQDMLFVSVQPTSILLPIVGILLVSSEWSQRTALATFTLVPQRLRVLAAKLAASVAIAVGALFACAAIALTATAIASHGVIDAWSLRPAIAVQVAVYVVSAMIMGVGFGALFLSSAPAIVLSFVLPLGWSAIASIPGVDTVARWFDPSRALGPLTDHMLSATEWARAGTTLAVWMLLPLAIGAWRILRSEVR